MRDFLLYRLLPFALCLAVLTLLRTTGLGAGGWGAQSVTVAVGFLLIGAFIAGKAATAVKLPRITGYLVVGVVMGPYATELLTQDMLLASRTIDGVAVALIALIAGGEIKLDWMRARLRPILTITLIELTLVATLIFGVVLIGRQLFPFMPNDDLPRALVIGMIFGVLAVSSSPTVTIAVIADTRSDGVLSKTVLGVTVLKDVLIIILFATAMAIARDALSAGGADETPLGLTLARELGGSALAGVAFGMAISWHLVHIKRDVPVFVLFVCFAMSELARVLHLEALLIALVAGLWVENFSKADGHALIDGIERVATPVLALFFAAAGAKMDLGAFAVMWHLALLLVAVRALGVWGGITLGARVAGAEPVVRKLGWLGFISQAGVSLALSAIVVRAFPDWGAEVQVLIIAMIAVHEVVGPIGFQHALTVAGEVGRARRPGAEPAATEEDDVTVPI